MNINKALWKARVVGFLSEAGTLLALTIVGVLGSPQFLALLTTNFGKGLLGSVLVLVVSGGVKHLQNLKTIKAARERFGSLEQSDEPLILL